MIWTMPSCNLVTTKFFDIYLPATLKMNILFQWNIGMHLPFYMVL